MIDRLQNWGVVMIIRTKKLLKRSSLPTPIQIHSRNRNTIMEYNNQCYTKRINNIICESNCSVHVSVCVARYKFWSLSWPFEVMLQRDSTLMDRLCGFSRLSKMIMCYLPARNFEGVLFLLIKENIVMFVITYNIEITQRQQ